MPNPVEGLLKVYEDMVEVLLVLSTNVSSIRQKGSAHCSITAKDSTQCDTARQLKT